MSLRRASRTSLGASSGSSVVVGSPGNTAIRKKRMNETPRMVGRASPRRLAILIPIDSLALHPDLAEVGVPGIGLDESLDFVVKHPQVKVMNRVEDRGVLHDG